MIITNYLNLVGSAIFQNKNRCVVPHTLHSVLLPGPNVGSLCVAYRNTTD